MDDMPVWMAARAGRRLSIPHPQEAGDIPAIVARRDGAAQFAGMLVEDFREGPDQVADGTSQVMGIAPHPHIAGRPCRLRALRGALQAILEHRDTIWPRTAGGILDHCLAPPGGGIPA